MTTNWTNEERKAALRLAFDGASEGQPVEVQREPHAQAHYTTVNHEALRIAAGVALDDWTAHTFETPARPPTLSGDVAVPALQATICGALAAILAGAAILATDAPLSGWAAVGAGAVVTAASWGWLLADHRRLLRTRETYTRRDAHELTPEPDRLRLEVQQDRGDGRAHWLMEDLPTDRARFLAWARAVLGGRSVAQGGWIGQSGPFSRSEYDALLAAMLRAGVLRWRNPRAHAQGAELTAMGRATLRKLTEGEQ
jgi:hypothetical protein